MGPPSTSPDDQRKGMGTGPGKAVRENATRGRRQTTAHHGTRVSTHVKRAPQSNRDLHVRRQYKKIKDKLGGEASTYVNLDDLDGVDGLDGVEKDPVASTSGRRARGQTTGGGADEPTEPAGDPAKNQVKRRNRTKEKKAFFKKTRRGQPVMKTRIDRLLESIQSS